MKSSSNPETHVIIYERGELSMFEDLRSFIKNASGHAVEVVLEFPQATCKAVTPSEKANISVDIAETLSWEMGRTFLKNSFTSPLRDIIFMSEFVLDRIKFTVKRLFKSVQEVKTLDFEVQSFTSNIRDGVNVHDSDGCVDTFIFSVALEEKIELDLGPYSEPADKNIVNISINGAPNTGRTFVASIIRKALHDAGIRNVDVSQCGNDIVQLGKQGISAFVLDGIIERGITYVISDNVKKPSTALMDKRDDVGARIADKLFNTRFTNANDYGYKLLSFEEAERTGVLGVFVKGNKGYNGAIIQEFMNFDATGRNNLVGDEYLSVTGFEVKVGFLNRQSELEELKEEFKVDLPEFSDGGCGGWYVLTLVDYAKPAWNPLQFGKQELSPTLTEMPVHIVGGRLPIVSRSTDPDEPLSFQSHHVVGPQGCSFTVGRSKRTPEIFVVGNEGYNHEIIAEFVDMGRAMRNELVGQSFQIKRGVTVYVGVIASDADFADIKERFDIDLKALKNVIPGQWWLLTPRP